MPWITLSVLSILGGIIYAIIATKRHIYMLQDRWSGQCIYIGCSKAHAIDPKILPAANKLGLDVISLGGLALFRTKRVPQDLIEKHKPIKPSYPYFEKMEK